MSERLPVTPETVVNRLDDDALRERIEMGRVTLAMIRPHVRESVNFDAESEFDVRNTLEGQIARLGINMKSSMRLDEEAVTEFYTDVVDRQLKKARKPYRRTTPYASKSPVEPYCIIGLPVRGGQ